jgi:AcrR family transcriptional regulator
VTAPQRRNEQARQAILRAAFELCQQRGYAALTIEGVAARAGVGKQTIYRWWPSKGAVVLEAFQEQLEPALATPLAADPELAGLPEILRRSAKLLCHPLFGRMLADLVGAVQHDPALAIEFQEKVYEPIRSGTLERVRRAQQSGVLRTIDPDLVADLLFGPLWFRLLLMRVPPTPEYADQVIDAVLAGLRAENPGH